MANLHFLKSVELFEGLSESELTSLLPLMEKFVFEKGEVVFNEGEEGRFLYIILDGEVEVLKEGRGAAEGFQLGSLKRHDWFGEMVFFGVSTRADSAKASTRTEVLGIPLEKLIQLAKEEGLYSRIVFNLARKMNSRIDAMNQKLVGILEKKIQILRTHDHMSHLIINLFFLFVFFFYTYKLFDEYAPTSWMEVVVPSVLILCFMGSVIWLVKKSGDPLSVYGVTSRKWKRYAMEGAILTLPILIAMVPFKWLLIQTVPAFRNLELFSLGSSGGDLLHSQHSFLPIILYCALVPLQEFIARGCLQTTLQNFFRSPNRVFLAILTSNLLFFLFHGFKSFSFAAFAFVFGLFWGWLYSRQQSIVGSSVSHILLGFWAFGFLNFQSILIR